MASLIITAWSLAFPFLYGLLFSRIFGIKQKLDQWILVTLQVSASVICGVLFVMAGWCLNASSLLDTQLAEITAAVIAFFAPMVVFHGLVWQTLLRDRKLNGFLISLICCSTYVLPFVIAYIIHDIF